MGVIMSATVVMELQGRRILASEVDDSSINAVVGAAGGKRVGCLMPHVLYAPCVMPAPCALWHTPHVRRRRSPGVGDGDDHGAAVVAGRGAVDVVAVAVVEGGGVALHLVAAAADSRRHGGRRERVAGEAGKVRWRGLGGCEGWDWSAVGRVSRDSRWQCAGTRTRLQWQTQTQTQVLVLSGEGQ